MGMRRILAFSSLALLTTGASAWDAAGHEVVVQIAMDTCSASTAKKVRALLTKAHWGDENEHRTGVMRDYTNPVIAARFADDIVDSIWGSNPFKEGKQRYKEWHYLNEMLDGSIGHSKGPGDVIQGIDLAVRKMNGESVGFYSGGKMEALIFLLHFVGDAHQPLHCIDDNDSGGHYDMTLESGTSIQCHKLWDSEATQAYKLKAASATQEPGPRKTALTKIKACAKSLEQTYGDGFTTAELKDLDPAHWAADSYKYASENLYHPPRTNPKNTVLDVWRKEALRKMTLAGMRLGKLLDKLAPNL